MRNCWKWMMGYLCCFASLSAASDWVVKEEFLSPDVAAFDCHGSSLVETGEGKLCAVWKGGPGEGLSNIDIKANVGIWCSLFNAGQWSEPIEIVSTSSVCWNPVLCMHPSGELIMFYRIGSNPRGAVSLMKKSLDGGKTWSKEKLLPAGIVGPTKNKPVVFSNGTLICPSSFAVGQPEDAYKAAACWIEITEDKGEHWKKIGPIELPNRKFGVVEPALFKDKEGRLHLFCRDRAHKIGGTGYIWEAISYDEGANWSDLQPTSFPNPDSGFDIADLKEGKIVLFYNHSHTDRFPLNFAISLDGGEHWSEPYVLDTAGEVPAAIVSSDGCIHVTYAAASENSSQRRIKHVVIDPFQKGK